ITACPTRPEATIRARVAGTTSAPARPHIGRTAARARRVSERTPATRSDLRVMTRPVKSGWVASLAAGALLQTLVELRGAVLERGVGLDHAARAALERADAHAVGAVRSFLARLTHLTCSALARGARRLTTRQLVAERRLARRLRIEAGLRAGGGVAEAGG